MPHVIFVENLFARLPAIKTAFAETKSSLAAVYFMVHIF